jgi:C1A family cysteine protease
LDQKTIGSCQSNGPAQALYISEKVAEEGGAKIAAYVLARLWLYFSLRWLEGHVNEDVGGNIGDAFRILASKGIPNEAIYPYDVTKFAQRPGPAVDMAAFDSRGNLSLNYHPISGGFTLITDIEKAVTSKRAVVFGCTVSEAFCSSQPNGVVQAPSILDKIAGGHCMTIVGFNHAEQWALVKNSWGKDWGDPACPPGCFKMSYSYLAHSFFGASDLWIVDALPGGLA